MTGETERELGRPHGGKRNAPDWAQHTVMLQKEEHWTALDLLRRHYPGRDMSDLLNDWNQRHQAKA